ncbi:alpha/beta hydrolase [Bacillus sp. FJAT-49711]|uniref:alpha/beta fold hydrolase n=1 Tax=Bacillus sp. FJAT-49711 TaxID=2833585 RepID=UPI001BC96114|nr:alpha/beta hydrolase [Bacillus sp. FJAT-49711]MBS4220710.1 alpha/beta hydrolase [Bacillus sp. FJAT-49711]
MVAVEGGRYIKVEHGVEMFVKDAGSGDPIVFIPGWTFTSEVFSKQIEYFQKTNRVIVMDPRSHGKSSITMHGNDYVTHGSDLVKIIEALELKNVTLVGWSFGCLTIWEYIRQQGTKNIKSLIFVDLSPKPLSINHEQDWVEGPLDEIAAAYTHYLQDRDKQREFISGYATGVMVQRELAETELNWLVEQSLKTPHYIAASLFASGMFSDYREEAKLASESVPVLTVIAEHWAPIAKAFTEKLTPQSSIEVLGGHLMFWEHSEKFNEIVESFLGGNR